MDVNANDSNLCVYLIQRHIISLNGADQALIGRHLREFRQLIANAPNKKLAHIALALISAENMRSVEGVIEEVLQ